MTVAEINARRLSISALERTRWLGHESAGGEVLPDRAWLAEHGAEHGDEHEEAPQ